MNLTLTKTQGGNGGIVQLRPINLYNKLIRVYP